MEVALLNALAPYVPDAAKPWNSERVQHLYRRLGVGADPASIQAGVAQSPAALVDGLLDGILAMPDPEAPYWANWRYSDYPADNPDLYFQVKYDFFVRWVQEAGTPALGLRAKLALFWHNHFVTEEETYDCNSFMWAYYDLLHRHALGNFRTFVEDMGRTPAMLSYLNGNVNAVGQPNENYARELMELFTMGEGNGYTQTDIAQMARALTGWRLDYNCTNIATFDPNRHDAGLKTIFGQTGPWGYTDVHDLIFTHRADETAHYICRKIYRAFLYDQPDEAVVSAMAEVFQDGGWELAPVFRALFKSNHFYERRFINAKIKSPIDALQSLVALSGMTYPEHYDDQLPRYVTYITEQMGQEVFNPVDVAGWPGQRAWLSEQTLTTRWSAAGAMIYWLFAGSPAAREQLRNIALALNADGENNPEVVTQAIARHYLNRNLQGPTLQAAVQYFKSEVPENYFDDGSWNLYYPEVPDQMLSLLYFLTRLPEWQLA